MTRRAQSNPPHVKSGRRSRFSIVAASCTLRGAAKTLRAPSIRRINGTALHERASMRILYIAIAFAYHLQIVHMCIDKYICTHSYIDTNYLYSINVYEVLYRT
jgi:hypothetical protein